MSDVETDRSLKPITVISLVVLVLAFLATLVLFPNTDLIVSGVFYRAGEGFFLADNPVFVFLHWLAVYGAWAMGFMFLCAAIAGYVRKQNVFSLSGKSWLFLFLALLLGPVLVANGVFKDNWGRARPHTVMEFGGTSTFTPAGYMAHECRRNCSFVSGDGAFGFFLPSFAYVVAPRRRRSVFWGMMLAGGGIGLARIAMGAHFFSDVIFAAVFMLGVSAVLHAVMYGRKMTITIWKEWIFPHSC